MLAALLMLACERTPVIESDQWRFPYTALEVYHRYKIAAEHVSWMETHRAYEWAWIHEARWMKRAWDLLDDCRRVHPSDAERCRMKLNELRVLIGDEAFWAGVMPDYVPFHRFTER